MDDRTKLTLVRMNLNNSFHKNADGKVIHGNRVNIFSEKEFHEKNDGKTNTKAHSLPYQGLSNTSDFLTALEELLIFTNTNHRDRIQLSINQGLLI
ncbi:hypothetical protein HF569_12020 [Lactobacillus sp. ZJLC3-7]|nr:hypothetical protein [Levilactobacillus tujiorum]